MRGERLRKEISDKQVNAIKYLKDEIASNTVTSEKVRVCLTAALGQVLAQPQILGRYSWNAKCQHLKVLFLEFC